MQHDLRLRDAEAFRNIPENRSVAGGMWLRHRLLASEREEVRVDEFSTMHHLHQRGNRHHLHNALHVRPRIERRRRIRSPSAAHVLRSADSAYKFAHDGAPGCDLQPGTFASDGSSTRRAGAKPALDAVEAHLNTSRVDGASTRRRQCRGGSTHRMASPELARRGRERDPGNDSTPLPP